MVDHSTLELTRQNQDIYFHLKIKADLIAEESKQFQGRLIDVGCGRMPYRNIILKNPAINEYAGVDIENITYQNDSRPDYFWDGKTLPFADESFDCSILIEVLEHVPEAEKVLIELSRVLKKDAPVLITVPFLWNLHDVPYDEFRYTPFSLKRIAEAAGFRVEKMEGLGGWYASLATMLSTFVRRGPMSSRKKQILSILFFPVVKYLFKRDKYNFKPAVFHESQMITGLKCILKKN